MKTIMHFQSTVKKESFCRDIISDKWSDEKQREKNDNDDLREHQ